MPEFVIALLELLEAEGRALKRSVRRVSFGLVFLLTASALILTALGFLLAAGYLALAAALGSTLAALIMGGVSLLLAATLGFIAYRTMR
ncbi:phage holin family protein [Halothiobacillus sp.]|uniref:phage holin family protein n=1 Tax=Halothiobacillus sp. TaxID=1891311 RepID=UPI003D0EDC3C